ncbi:MAG TPA: protein kinase [Thermoanaerobaculia bacterium]|jgi:hypothetical protein
MSFTRPLGPYLIGERVGTTVWLAEETGTGKKFAVKLLSRQLPKDASKRDALVRDVRVAAALYHAFLVPIVEISAIDENLLMVMEVVDVQHRTRSAPADRTDVFRFGYQLASVVKYLHIKGLRHGNLNIDSVMVTPEGQVRLGGLNLSNLLRRDTSSNAYQQKGSDPRSVAYMAPEQIASQMADEKSDVFSIGVLLYERATGKLPFPGNNASELARAVVEGQPVSPRSVHPTIDNGVMTLLGGCLFKDAFKRYKDAKAVAEAIEKLDSSAVAFALSFEKRIATASSAPSETRRSLMLVADIDGYDALAAEDPERATRAAARMQQVVGEAVYLFDGNVIDPFGTRVVAELPSVESALEAGRKAEFDLGAGRQEGERLAVRMLLHAGELEIVDSAPAGAAVQKAMATLAELPPNTLFISEAFVKEGRGNVRLRDAGARAGVKLYNIVAPEPAPVVAETAVDVTTAELEAEAAAELEAERIVLAAAARKRSLMLTLAAATVVVVVGAGGMMVWKRNAAPATPVRAVKAEPQRPTAEHPRAVYIAPFEVDTKDEAVAARANAIRLAAVEVLRSYPELQLVENPTRDSATFSARVRSGASGAELVPTSGKKSAPATFVADSASGIRAITSWVTAQVQAQPRGDASPEALNAFADAVVADAAHDDGRAESSLRAALAADPRFLPAQLMAMRLYNARGNDAASLEAARQVVALDPHNVDAARQIARASLSAGDLANAFAMYGGVLRVRPRDPESLNHVARYAASAGDAQRFRTALSRLRGLPASEIDAHEPDLLANAGRLGVAADRYYDVATASGTSAALSLKIGRLSVLRHSLPLADDELAKLGQSDPLYGYHMLSAYIAAEKRDRATAEKELKIALAASSPGDDSWTCAAEVYAILADTRDVMSALEKAAARKEPTAAYVLANPLFRYLEHEPRFIKVRETLLAEQAEIRSAVVRAL